MGQRDLFENYEYSIETLTKKKNLKKQLNEKNVNIYVTHQTLGLKRNSNGLIWR